ncbi:hypothetical protein GS908_01195 [Rhodococcus hoagii]|nr:hypothetical protein [Prescottella equi]
MIGKWGTGSPAAKIVAPGSIGSPATSSTYSTLRGPYALLRFGAFRRRIQDGDPDLFLALVACVLVPAQLPECFVERVLATCLFGD